ncbi:MAG: hypothetical protein Q3980_04820 [Turicibacter sp.]|nr:hypothetical protein [Turicibacter sp.]
MKKWYYAIFLVCLYLFNQAFKSYVEVYGLLEGILIGLVIAFLCKLVFKVVTKTIIFIAVVCGILVFLVSAGYIELPAELSNLLNLGMSFTHISHFFLI